MRGATECAKRLKLFVSDLRSRHGKVPHPQATDAISQLILGVLSRDAEESKAHAGLDRLRGIVVDYNELRVIPVIELAELLADFPDAWLKCEDLSRALNKIFLREHEVSLQRLHEVSRKEALEYLREIDGLDPYTIARIRLLGLQQHAVPLDEAMWALAREVEIVAPRCDLDEAQQFLERQIKADDALEFVAMLKKEAWSTHGAAVQAQEVERILSKPPDRTTQHMLADVSASLAQQTAVAPRSPDIESLVEELAEPVDSGDGDVSRPPGPPAEKRGKRRKTSPSTTTKRKSKVATNKQTKKSSSKRSTRRKQSPQRAARSTRSNSARATKKTAKKTRKKSARSSSKRKTSKAHKN